MPQNPRVKRDSTPDGSGFDVAIVGVFTNFCAIFIALQSKNDVYVISMFLNLFMVCGQYVIIFVIFPWIKKREIFYLFKV